MQVNDVLSGPPSMLTTSTNFLCSSGVQRRRVLFLTGFAFSCVGCTFAFVPVCTFSPVSASETGSS